MVLNHKPGLRQAAENQYDLEALEVPAIDEVLQEASLYCYNHERPQ